LDDRGHTSLRITAPIAERRDRIALELDRDAHPSVLLQTVTAD